MQRPQSEATVGCSRRTGGLATGGEGGGGESWGTRSGRWWGRALWSQWKDVDFLSLTLTQERFGGSWQRRDSITLASGWLVG